MQTEKPTEPSNDAGGASELTVGLDEEVVFAECPGYKSKTYYGVVIGADKHLGWHCFYVGDGAMKFKNNTGMIKNFHRRRAVDNWMEECWVDFLKMAEASNVI